MNILKSGLIGGFSANDKILAKKANQEEYGLISTQEIKNQLNLPEVRNKDLLWRNPILDIPEDTESEEYAAWVENYNNESWAYEDHIQVDLSQKYNFYTILFMGQKLDSSISNFTNGHYELITSDAYVEDREKETAANAFFLGSYGGRLSFHRRAWCFKQGNILFWNASVYSVGESGTINAGVTGEDANKCLIPLYVFGQKV